MTGPPPTTPQDFLKVLDTPGIIRYYQFEAYRNEKLGQYAKGSSGGMNTVKLANIMKALSNPNRLELYLEIAKKNQASFQTGGECFVSEIINSFDIGAPTISHHLKELTKAGLISTERRGKYLVATVNVKAIDEVSAELAFPHRKE